jgi:hypothetical protein
LISAPLAPLFLLFPFPAAAAALPFAPPPVFGAFLPELKSPNKSSTPCAAALSEAAFSAAAFFFASAAAFLSAAAFAAAALSAAAFSAAFSAAAF